MKAVCRQNVALYLIMVAHIDPEAQSSLTLSCHIAYKHSELQELRDFCAGRRCRSEGDEPHTDLGSPAYFLQKHTLLFAIWDSIWDDARLQIIDQPHKNIPDTGVELEGRTIYWAKHTLDSGMKRSCSVCIYINNRHRTQKKINNNLLPLRDAVFWYGGFNVQVQSFLLTERGLRRTPQLTPPRLLTTSTSKWCF